MDNKFGKDLSLNEFLSKTGYKKSSFYDRLDDMYGEKGAYKIPQYKFKKIGRKLGEREDQKKGDNDFLFKKEWADLAVVLTRMYKNNPMYSKASSYKKMNLDKFQAFNAYCLNEIENLNDNHKNEVKTHPIYGAMIMEKIMLERVQEQMNVLFRYLSDSQKVVLYDFAKQLEEYRLQYGKQVSDCKETVSHVFSVMNAEILRRN